MQIFCEISLKREKKERFLDVARNDKEAGRNVIEA